jgi:heptosyltransferase-2
MTIIDPAEIRTIAVRMTNWVGDCVMNTPFISRLHDIFPKARVIAMARASVAPVLDNHPKVHEVWVLDDRTRKGYRETANRLRSARVDLGFALPNSLNAAAVLFFGGARHRVGYDRDARRWLLTHPVPLRPQDLAVHEVRYYLRLLTLWDPAAMVNPPRLELEVTTAEREAMGAWLAARGVEPGQPVLGVNPAAFFGTAKRWFPERYAEVAGRLARQHGARVVVTGLPKERDVAQEVCERGGSLFYNAAGEMSLRQLMAFFTHSRMLLTNDSGAMHLAAALGTPLVAVFGSTDWVTTSPVSPWARIVRVETECAPCLLRHCPIDHRCMDRVTPGRVLEVAEELWDASCGLFQPGAMR